MPDKIIDRMIVELSTNYREFVKEIGKANSAVDDTEEELESLESTSKKAATGVERVGNASKKAATDIDSAGAAASAASRDEKSLANETEKANTALEGGARNAKKAADAYDQAGKKAEGAGDKSKTASEKTGGLNEEFGKMVTGKLAAVLSLAAIAGAIVNVGTKAIEAKNQVQEFTQSVTRAYGLSKETQEMVQTVARELPQNQPGVSFESASSIAGTLASTFPTMATDKNTLTKWTSEFAAFSKTTGTDDMQSFIASFYDTVKKYDLREEEYTKLLSELTATQQAIGRPDSKATDLISILKGGDMFAAYTGKDIYGVLDYYGEAARSGEGDEARQFIGMYEDTLLKISEKLGQQAAESYLQGMAEGIVNSKSLAEATKTLVKTYDVPEEYAKTIAEAIRANKEVVKEGESVDAIVTSYLSSESYSGTEKLAGKIAQWVTEYSAEKAVSLVTDSEFARLSAEWTENLPKNTTEATAILSQRSGMRATEAKAIAEGFAAANDEEYLIIKADKLASLTEKGMTQYLESTATDADRGGMKSAQWDVLLSGFAESTGLANPWTMIANTERTTDLHNLRSQKYQELLETENEQIIKAYQEYYEYILRENLAGHISRDNVERVLIATSSQLLGDTSGDTYSKLLGDVESSEKYSPNAFFSGRYGTSGDWDILSVEDYRREVATVNSEIETSSADIVSAVGDSNQTLVKILQALDSNPRQNIIVITGKVDTAKAIQLAELEANRQYNSPLH